MNGRHTQNSFGAVGHGTRSKELEAGLWTVQALVTEAARKAGPEGTVRGAIGSMAGRVGGPHEAEDRCSEGVCQMKWSRIASEGHAGLAQECCQIGQIWWRNRSSCSSLASGRQILMAPSGPPSFGVAR